MKKQFSAIVAVTFILAAGLLTAQQTVATSSNRVALSDNTLMTAKPGNIILAGRLDDGQPLVEWP